MHTEDTLIHSSFYKPKKMSLNEENFKLCHQSREILLDFTKIYERSRKIIVGVGTGHFYFFGLFSGLWLSPLAVLWLVDTIRIRMRIRMRIGIRIGMVDCHHQE